MKKIRVAKNKTLSATAGVTAAATGVTMLMFEGSTATVGAAGPQGGFELVERRQRAVEHIEPLLDAGADLRRPAHPFGDRRGQHRQHASAAAATMRATKRMAVTQGDT